MPRSSWRGYWQLFPEIWETFRKLCAGEKNWGAIFESAERNGIAAILYHYLVQVKVLLPPELESEIKRQLTLDWVVQLRLRAALDEALETLQAAGVRTVALKGPLIAERIYAEEFLRSSSDVDLMVSLADLDGAQAALEAIGYQAQTGVLARYSRENHHHLHFNRPQDAGARVAFPRLRRFRERRPFRRDDGAGRSVRWSERSHDLGPGA